MVSAEERRVARIAETARCSHKATEIAAIQQEVNVDDYLGLTKIRYIKYQAFWEGLPEDVAAGDGDHHFTEQKAAGQKPMVNAKGEPIVWVEENPRICRVQGWETRVIEGMREQTDITVEEAATKRRRWLWKQTPVALAARNTTASGSGMGQAPPTDCSADGLGHDDDLDSLRSCDTSRCHGPLSEATLELHNRAHGHAKTTPPSDAADNDAYTKPPDGGWTGVKLMKQKTSMKEHAARLL